MWIEGEQVFVTGGAGFIGRHLVRALLARGATCVIIDRDRRGSKSLGDLVTADRVVVQPGDLRFVDLSSALRGCTAVVHLAAHADVRSGEDHPRDVFEDNVLATARLLDAMGTAGVTRLGFASTSTVYGEATVLPTPEDYAPLRPISIYGSSKLAAEGLIHGYAAKHGLSAVVWRLANVVGPGGTRGVVPDFIRRLRANPKELEILGRKPGTRKSYVHVDDVVDAMVRTWPKARRGVEAFNIGSEDAITVKEVADLVCRALELPKVRYRWTGGANGGGWRGDVRGMTLAVDRLKARGWRPRHRSAEAVLRAAKELVGGPEIPHRAPRADKYAPVIASSMDEKILTKHPQGKKGVHISREKYETMRVTILSVLRKNPLTHDELTAAVENRLRGKFEGSIPWYMEATKLDLEAKKVIERVARKGPATYRLR